VALDSADAGVGDRVLLVMEGFSAMTAVGRPESPIDMAVIGVIDEVDLVTPPVAGAKTNSGGEEIGDIR
jgi:microcompartment protein CcmK/EutM